ncbi:hypothetical protein ACJRO7_001834 [Eucalyptus globulus]|uniref:Uncharacterized protein n=1 Tax=Eucalyptus globulus TaxID=34317 RepID=A0ABD3LSD0_EUCGL
MESSGASSTRSKSDGGDREEEVVSLASTVERIMKNLRQEITQLRKSLEESRDLSLSINSAVQFPSKCDNGGL